MAHFAKLGDNNIVEQVIVVNNDVATTEELGVNFCKSLYGQDTIWKKTSYNTNAGVHRLGGTPLRKNFAGIGMTYDEVRDAFIPIQPFNSWILNENTCIWEAPINYPDDGKPYNWNEENQTWNLIE
jgi:hypothetical protein